jgi:hypothetical protein
MKTYPAAARRFAIENEWSYEAFADHANNRQVLLALLTRMIFKAKLRGESSFPVC